MVDKKFDVDEYKARQDKAEMKNRIAVMILILAVVLILVLGGSGIEFRVINNWVIGVFLILVAATLHTPWPYDVKPAKNRVLLPLTLIFSCGVLISLSLTFISDEAVLGRQIARGVADYVDVEIEIWERSDSEDLVIVRFLVDEGNNDISEFSTIVIELTAQAILVFDDHDIENYRINVSVGYVRRWGGTWSRRWNRWHSIRSWETDSVYAYQHERWGWSSCPHYPYGSLSGDVLQYVNYGVGQCVTPSEINELIEGNSIVEQLTPTLQASISGEVIVSQVRSQDELEFQGVEIQIIPPEDIYHGNFEGYVMENRAFVEVALNDYDIELYSLSFNEFTRYSTSGVEYRLSWNTFDLSEDGKLLLRLMSRTNRWEDFHDISFDEVSEKIENFVTFYVYIEQQLMEVLDAEEVTMSRFVHRHNSGREESGGISVYVTVPSHIDIGDFGDYVIYSEEQIAEILDGHNEVIDETRFTLGKYVEWHFYRGGNRAEYGDIFDLSSPSPHLSSRTSRMEDIQETIEEWILGDE